MKEERELLLELLHGDLADDEADALRRRLQREPDLRNRLDQLRALDTTLRASTADAFAPYFSERVMRRLASDSLQTPSASLYDALQWLFLRVAMGCLLIAIGLGTYNALDARSTDLASSRLEAVFGLPSPSLDTLFFLEGM